MCHTKKTQQITLIISWIVVIVPFWMSERLGRVSSSHNVGSIVVFLFNPSHTHAVYTVQHFVHNMQCVHYVQQALAPPCCVGCVIVCFTNCSVHHFVHNLQHQKCAVQSAVCKVHPPLWAASSTLPCAMPLILQCLLMFCNVLQCFAMLCNFLLYCEVCKMHPPLWAASSTLPSAICPR